MQVDTFDKVYTILLLSDWKVNIMSEKLEPSVAEKATNDNTWCVATGLYLVRFKRHRHVSNTVRVSLVFDTDTAHTRSANNDTNTDTIIIN